MALPPFSKHVYAPLWLLMLFTACTKNNTINAPGNNINQIMAVVNGEDWQSGVNNTANTGIDRQVFALRPDSSSIQLYFPLDTLGSYDLATDSRATVAYRKGNVLWSTELSGNLTLLENSPNTLEGNFSAVLVSVFNSDTVFIENGHFTWRF